MKPEWIVIANASHARILEQSRGEALHLVRTFTHPASRLRAHELADGKAGREQGQGPGGAAYMPRLDAQHKEHLRFARELATFIEENARANRLGSLSLFAASPFLGHLKQFLGDAAQALLAGSHDVDLSHVGIAELPTRVEAQRLGA